jgi:hypothetical protein
MSETYEDPENFRERSEIPRKRREKQWKKGGKPSLLQNGVPVFVAPYNLDDIVQSRSWRKKEKRCLDELLDLFGDIVHLGSVCYE